MKEFFLSDGDRSSNAPVYLRPVLGVLATVVAARVAYADRPVRVDVAGAAPVTADQLATALRVRVAATGPAIVVQLRSAGGGDVVARIADRERSIALAGRTGEDAARLIALAIADLALDDVAGDPAPSTAVVAVAASRSAGRDAGATAVTVTFLGAASAWSSVMAGGGVDVAIARGTWLAAAEVEAGQLVEGDLHLGDAVVRLGGGWRRGALELRAGATVAPVWVGNGAGDSTVLAGGGASARLRVPVARDVRFVLAVGVDAFATRSEYVIETSEPGAAGATMTEQVATPWLAPWVAVGAEVTP